MRTCSFLSVNGGIEQPGCSASRNQSVLAYAYEYSFRSDCTETNTIYFLNCFLPDILGNGSCNHDRAPIYFAESINSDKGFWYACNVIERFKWIFFYY